MKGILILAGLVALPPCALAQAVAGSVRDGSGARMRGVTVQTISEALIEKVRTTVTDDRGEYRIEGLRPGTYTVRFTLQGWRTHQQQGVQITGSFTAAVNAELAVGPLTETVTVAGAVPLVDVRRVTQQIALAGEVVRSLPTARSYNALLVLVPGVVTTTNDTVTASATTMFPVHGGRANEGRLTLDGLPIGSPPSGNSAASYVVDLGLAEEVTFTTGSALGEVETSGLVMDIVPRTGGNTTRGSLFASGTGRRLHSSNLTADLREQGVVAPTPLTEAYDISGSLGGPIRKDRAWYFVSAHLGGSTREVTNVYYNLNAADPSRWLYAPDLTRREYSDRLFENAGARLTWQATPRHKIGGFWDAQALCRTCTGATPGLSEPARVSPEAVGVLGRPLHVWQATWSSPLAERWLVEAGFGGTWFGAGNFERNPNPTRSLVRVLEQCASGCAANGDIPGLVYRSQDFSEAHASSQLWRASASYVTGSHSLKIGYQHTLMTDDRTWWTNDQNVTYRFNNGVPNQLTQSISPWVNDARAAWQALFVQNHWTRKRITLQGALRFDRAWSWFPNQQEGPSRFLPTPIDIPETRGVESYKDLTLRMGAAYDVFGTGRTALKVSVGNYLEGAGVTGTYANTNPTLRMPQTTPALGPPGVTRAWIDANANYIPDCDLMNPDAQDRRAGGGDLCGALSNTDFGSNVLVNRFDPALLDGWGVRPSDRQLFVSIQQQIGSRASIDVSYIRRSFRGFSVVDNLMLDPADLTPFSITAPIDPRLPGGGGYPVPGLYDVVPEKTGQVDNFVTAAANQGRWHQSFTGLDMSLNIRSVRGFALAAGTSTGETLADNCAVRAAVPELATTTTGTSVFGPGLGNSAVTPVSPYCRVAFGVLTQLRGFASYAIPKGDIQVSATFQSKPGPMLAANYAVPNAVAARSLGRDLSGNAQNVTVNLVPPGTMYGRRINQFDVRVAKTFRFRRTRTLIAADIYNALNSSAVLAYNSTFVPDGPWLQPLSILTPRFLKITAEIEF